MLDRNGFWKLIEHTRHRDTEQQYLNIRGSLTPLSAEDVCLFWQYASLYVEHSESPATYIACKLLNGCASDDTELYFRCWLVAQGKEVFFGTLKDIDHLSDLDLPGPPYEFEMLMGAVVSVLEEKAGDIESVMEKYTMPSAEAAEIEMEIETNREWGEDEDDLWDQASVRAPKLWSKYNGV